MWVEQTKNGKYKFIERYPDFITGKTKRVSVTLEKDTARNRKLAQAALQCKIEKALCKEESKGITLEKLVESYRKDQKRTVKSSTYRRNYHACNTLLDLLGKDSLVDRLTAGYIRERFLASKKESGTLNEHLKRLKALIRWGYKNDYVSDIRYLDKIEPFKDKSRKEKVQDKFLETTELSLLLKEMNVPRWRNLTEFLALSGLRFGEAVALTNNDIDYKQRVIIVSKTYDVVNEVCTTPKTLCSTREVYMQDELLQLCHEIQRFNLKFRDYTGYVPHNLFLESSNGDYIRFYTYNKYLKENSERILGRKITAHALRHTHASLLMQNGVDKDTISRRLGHENSRITEEIYLHVTKELKRLDQERLADIQLL